MSTAPTFTNWGASSEGNEGVFYAISRSERVGPYSTWAAANERAKFENENERGNYYSSKRVGSLHEETPRNGTSYCNTCGDVSDLDPDSEAAQEWHGDSVNNDDDD